MRQQTPPAPGGPAAPVAHLCQASRSRRPATASRGALGGLYGWAGWRPSAGNAQTPCSRTWAGRPALTVADAADRLEMTSCQLVPVARSGTFSGGGGDGPCWMRWRRPTAERPLQARGRAHSGLGGLNRTDEPQRMTRRPFRCRTQMRNSSSGLSGACGFGGRPSRARAIRTLTSRLSRLFLFEGLG